MNQEQGGVDMNAQVAVIEAEDPIFTHGEKRALFWLTGLTCLGAFVVFLVPQDSRIVGVAIPLLSVFAMICIVVKAGVEYRFRRK